MKIGSECNIMPIKKYTRGFTFCLNVCACCCVHQSRRFTNSFSSVLCSCADDELQERSLVVLEADQPVCAFIPIHMGNVINTSDGTAAPIVCGVFKWVAMVTVYILMHTYSIMHTNTQRWIYVCFLKKNKKEHMFNSWAQGTCIHTHVCAHTHTHISVKLLVKVSNSLTHASTTHTTTKTYSNATHFHLCTICPWTVK